MTKIREDQYFWVNNGPIVKDLPGLLTAVQDMDNSKFDYHAKGDNNDFCLWIDLVLGEPELAKKLRKLKTRKGFARSLQREIA